MLPRLGRGLAQIAKQSALVEEVVANCRLHQNCAGTSGRELYNLPFPKGKQSVHRLASVRSFATASASTAVKVHASGSRSAWILLVPSGIAAFLGVWQVARCQWKSNLLEQRAAALQAEPTPLKEGHDPPPEYTRVVCQGQFLYDRTIFVGPRPRSFMGVTKPGYLLITPLQPSPGSHGREVLVNRGWVPADWREDAKQRATIEPEGQIQVEGIVRAGETQSNFVPDNDPKNRAWYWVDAPALAQACGLSRDTPFVEVVSDTAGPLPRGPVPTSVDVLAMRAKVPLQSKTYPVARDPTDLLHFSVMPKDHILYALTWFTLATFTGGLAWRAAKPAVKKARQQIRG